MGGLRYVLYFLSIMIPLIGFIAGAILVTRDNPKDKRVGKICLALGVVSFVISAILNFALYIIVSNMMSSQNYQPKTIAIGCTKIAGAFSQKCTIVNADAGVDFNVISINVQRSDGMIVAHWDSHLKFTNGIVANTSASPPVSQGRLIDNGDNRFGVGDVVYLIPMGGQSLAGYRITMSGGGAYGSATLP